MREVGHDRFSAVKKRIEHLHVFEHYASTHLLIADMQEFDGLKEVVGEVAVKPAFDSRTFVTAKMRKASGEIVGHCFAPVADDVVNQGIYACG